jgi:hypothetical protein
MTASTMRTDWRSRARPLVKRSRDLRVSGALVSPPAVARTSGASVSTTWSVPRPLRKDERETLSQVSLGSMSSAHIADSGVPSDGQGEPGRDHIAAIQSRRKRTLQSVCGSKGTRPRARERKSRMSTIRQCPHCELRFTNSFELEDHLASDHPTSESEQRENSQ